MCFYNIKISNMKLLLALSLLAITFAAILPSDLTNYINAELAKHNELRGRHGCPALVINETLNTIAQNYTDYLYNNSLFGHSEGAKTGLYGENLYKAWGWPSYTYPTAAASVSWYSQSQYYDYSTFKSNTTGKVVGHFTAMIWKAATSVGFGFVNGPASNGGYTMYVTANYYPVTNVGGQYAANVPQLI